MEQFTWWWKSLLCWPPGWICMYCLCDVWQWLDSLSKFQDEIRATGFNELVDKFYDTMEKGKVTLSVCLPFSVCVCLPVCLFLSVFLPATICLPACLSLSVFVCPYVCFPFCLSLGTFFCPVSDRLAVTLRKYRSLFMLRVKQISLHLPGASLLPVVIMTPRGWN